MQKDAEGLPLRGNRRGMLGVRVPTDIKLDDEVTRAVSPGGGGLSVVPDDPVRLPLHYRPKTLGGHGTWPVFSIEPQQLGEPLSYRPDSAKPKDHGFLEPARVMTIEEYQAALAGTVNEWQEVPQ